ncbi:hypothetical protein CPB84DRAFT_1848169 [Gymnopilus junonius]|uniref:Uncharacterized protein n=1 Tax=Gymnopilus junonius TaxID=109634 RepID=A0A9P5NIK9_GYMJU|nr:hypothetical protein CPB84DRAFT_1848169 [Gymnopilus junonius]
MCGGKTAEMSSLDSGDSAEQFKKLFHPGISHPHTAPNSRSSTPIHLSADQTQSAYQLVQSSLSIVSMPSNQLPATRTAHETVITPSNGGDSTAAVRLELEPSASDGTGARAHDKLDHIYSQILSSVDKNADIWPILLAILTTQNPLAPGIMSKVLHILECQVLHVVSSLHSVLTRSSEPENYPITYSMHPSMFF